MELEKLIVELRMTHKHSTPEARHKHHQASKRRAAKGKAEELVVRAG
jgi:hypothetical protein